jgi:thiosulfate/3-mercaptopyruvate sulfurtransferase
MMRVPQSCLHLVIAAILLVFWPCFLRAQAYVDAERQPSEVSSQMLVSTEWLAEHLNDGDVLVLCIATPSFYSRGHIPGAHLLALKDIAVTRDGVPNQLPSSQQLKKVFESAGASDLTRIILYGERSGLLAAHAYWALDYLGVADDAALLDGGLEKWQAEGRPLSQEPPEAVAGHLSLQLNPSVLVTAADLEKTLHEKPSSITLLDARPMKEFSGEKLSEDVSKAGHIPGARNLYWKRNLESAENPILLRDGELRAIYQELGASADRPLVTYCRTGMQSSFDYFVAKYLGYKVRMYPGSFLDWSRKDLPVENHQGSVHH